MKFQLKMGQTESLKKIRELKKDIARVQTVVREKELAAATERRRAKTPVGKAAATAPVKTRKAATKKAATEKK